jgi:rare lipoprotein A
MKRASRLVGLFGALATAAASIAQTPPAAAPAPAASPPPAVAPAAGTPAPAPAVAAPAAKSGDAMEGLAAVYSDKLAGHKTASGQVFSQSAMTAAHPSLPFGTKLKVTNTRNDKSVEVKVNDRGPMQAGRVIYLSRSAAAKIGIGKKGTAPVKLEVVGEAPAKKEAKKAA